MLIDRRWLFFHSLVSPSAPWLWTGSSRQPRPGSPGTKRQRHHSTQAGPSQRHQAGGQTHPRFRRERTSVEQQAAGGSAELRGTERYGAGSGSLSVLGRLIIYGRGLRFHSFRLTTPSWRTSQTTWSRRWALRRRSCWDRGVAWNLRRTPRKGTM